MYNYGTKYAFEFASEEGKEFNVYLKKKNYTGEVIVRSFGGSPVLKREKNGRIYGTSLTLKLECLVDQEFVELYDPDPTMWRVECCEVLGDNPFPLFIGFLDPEMYSEPDIWPPYDVEVTATDRLGTLKDIDFDPTTYTLPITYGSLLVSVLGKAIQGETSIRFDFSGVSINQATGVLQGPTISDLSVYEDKNCYEVLESLLALFNLYITRGASGNVADDGWVLFSMDGLKVRKDSSDYLCLNSISNEKLPYMVGSLCTIDDEVGPSYENNGEPFHPLNYLSAKIEPAKKSVKVSCNYDYDRELLVNPDLNQHPTDGVRGWTLGGSAFAHVANSQIDSNENTLFGVTIPNSYSAALSQTINIPEDINLPVKLTFSFAYLSRSATGVRKRLSLSIKNSWIAGVIAGATIPRSVIRSLRIAGDNIDTQSGKPSKYHYGVTPGEVSNLEWSESAEFYCRPDSSSIMDGKIDPKETTLVLPFIKAGTLTITFMGDDNSSSFIDRCSLKVDGSKAVKGAVATVNIANGARNAAKEETVDFISGAQASEFLYANHIGLSSAVQSASDYIDLVENSAVGASRALEFVALSMAHEVALPRLRVQGTLMVPPLKTAPMVLRKYSGATSMDFFLETFSWNLLNDEMEVELVSLPSADIDVTSLTVTTSEKK